MNSKSINHIQNKYFDEVRRKRTYSTIFFMIFFLLMVSGFIVADDRNAGGFWDGLDKIFDFPAEVVNEAVEKGSGLPALLVKFMPSLIETINIALVSTLLVLCWAQFCL